MSEPTIRTASADEFEEFRHAFATVFAFEPNEADAEDFKKWLEWDRSFLAEDDGDIVATGGAVSYRLTVPGGELLAAGGLTVIAVKPTHRRQGLLRRMMDRHFEDCDGRGEPLSILWASEAPIYGRFGYGLSVEMRDLTIERAHSALRSDLPEPEGRFRLTDPDGARDVVPALQQASTVGRAVPGSIEPRPVDWEANLADYEHRRRGASRLHFAIYERDGEPRGYARYRLKSSWDGVPEGTVVLHELHALDGEAYIALWRYVFGIDLMKEIKAHNRPVGDPLYRILADPRRVRSTGLDALWVRILDVPAALSSRKYQVEGSLLIEVVDDSLPSAGGIFRLEGGPDGAECAPASGSPDLRLSTSDLAAAYLGAPRLAAQGWLGVIDGADQAIALADDMFRWGATPATFVHF